MKARKVTGWMLSLICALSLAVAVRADETAPTLLRFKFVPEQVTALELKVVGEGQMQTTGAPGGRDLDSSLELSLALPLDLITDSVDAEGNGRLRMRLGAMDMQVRFAEQAVHMVMDLAQGTMTLEVNGKAMPAPMPAPPVGKLLEKMVMVLSPQGQLLNVEGLDQPPAGLGLGMVGSLMGGLAPEQMLEMMKAQQPALPEQPVKIGDSWQHTAKLPFPPDSPVPVVTDFTLQGLETVAGHLVARVGLDMTLELQGVPLPASPRWTEDPGAAGPPPGAPSGNTLETFRMEMHGDMCLPRDGGYIQSAHLEIALDMESSSLLPASVGGGTMRTRLKDLKLTYDLTPRVK